MSLARRFCDFSLASVRSGLEDEEEGPVCEGSLVSKSGAENEEWTVWL